MLDHADTVLIGAGASLSTSAGFTYDGARFEKYFSDFAAKYGSGVLAPEPYFEFVCALFHNYLYAASAAVTRPADHQLSLYALLQLGSVTDDSNQSVTFRERCKHIHRVIQ